MAARQSRVERRELSLFCRQLSTMLVAGIDILIILEVLQRQSENPAFREILTSVEKDLRLGRMLSDALERFPETFSPFFISLVRQGERDDELETALSHLAESVERDLSLDGLPARAVGSQNDFAFVCERVWPLFLVSLVVLAALWVAVVLIALARLDLHHAAAWAGGVAAVATLALAIIFHRLRPFQTERCAFCGRSHRQVRDLVRARSVAICGDCVADFDTRIRIKTAADRQIAAAEAQAQTAPPPPGAPRVDEEVDLAEETSARELGMEIVKEEDYY